MTAPVVHINLLQRTAKLPTVPLALVALLALTLLGTAYHASELRAEAQAALRQRDDVARQVKDVQARMAALSGQQAKSATALALRKEVDALQPQAQAARALNDAVRAVEGGRTEEFARAMTAMAGLQEPGLWLTAMTVSAGGKRLEVQGEANNGAAVLRYARRANQLLQPFALRLDTLEMQPKAAGATAAGTGAVSFRLN